MNPKLSALFATGLLVGTLLVATAGCTTAVNASRSAARPVNRPATYALAVAVRGGVEPTPAQWNLLYLKFSQALADRGLLLINDYTRAENIIHVEFLPDPINPHLGTALISSIAANPGLYARTPSLGFSTANTAYGAYPTRGQDSPWGANAFAYDRSDQDGYTGSNSTSTPPTISAPGLKPAVPPSTPPHHKHALDPGDCPPGTTPYQRPPGYVGNDTNRHAGHGPTDGRRPPPASDSSSTRPPTSSSGNEVSSGDSSRGSAFSSSSNAPTFHSSSSSGATSSSFSSAPAPSDAAPSYSAPSDASSASAGRESTTNKQMN